MRRWLSANVVGSPVFEFGGAWIPLVLTDRSGEERIGVYIHPDRPRRRVSGLGESLSIKTLHRLEREVLIQFDLDLAERVEYTFDLMGGVFGGREYSPERESEEYERLVRNVSRQIGIANFIVPRAAGIGIALFREAPSRECLRELAQELYGIPYLNVFTSSAACSPTIMS